VAGVSGVAPLSVLVSSPSAPNERPIVTVEQPEAAVVDFGGGGVLQGSGSDPDGDALTYLWVQTAGPPAAIADPSVPATSFTLGTGSGAIRVAFQLTAYDGIDASLPAEVEFRMPDNFFVREMGATDADCDSLETCQAAGGDTVSAARGRLTVWVDLLNINAGDRAAFEIRSPEGETALSGRFCDPAAESAEQSFWRFSWSTSGSSGLLEPGTWRLVYLRNGLVEGSHEFTVVP